MQLRCLNEKKAARAMEEVHEGVCGLHMNGTIMAKKLIRQELFWMTMMEDRIKFVLKCHNYQIHGDISHLPRKSYTPSLLHGPSQH